MGRKSCSDFSIGDKVVYPGYGVGEISKIEERDLAGRKDVFLVLSFRDTENVSTVMIPNSSISSVGLRAPSSQAVVKKALDFLKEGVPETFSTWKDRFTAHSAMVAKGDLMSIAQVLKSLHIQNQKKPLSFREKKLYQRCILLMSSEAALVKKLTRDNVEKHIEELLGGKS